MASSLGRGACVPGPRPRASVLVVARPRGPRRSRNRPLVLLPPGLLLQVAVLPLHVSVPVPALLGLLLLLSLILLVEVSLLEVMLGKVSSVKSWSSLALFFLINKYKVNMTYDVVHQIQLYYLSVDKSIQKFH